MRLSLAKIKSKLRGHEPAQTPPAPATEVPVAASQPEAERPNEETETSTIPTEETAQPLSNQTPDSTIPVAEEVTGASPDAEGPLNTEALPASETPPEPTLSTLQVQLWTEAYDAIKKADPKLIDSYERILSSKLQELELGVDTEKTGDNSISHTGEERWVQMQAIAKYSLKQTEKASAVADKATQALKVITTIKGVVSSALQSVPQAAVVWTGVCLGLEVLSSSIVEYQSNRSGLKYVLLRMDWYWNLAMLLLKENIVEESSQKVRESMKNAVVKLYEKLLEYQIKSVCVHSRNWLVKFGLNTIKVDDWDGKLKSVKDEEAQVTQFAKQYNSELVKSTLYAMLEATQSLETKLVDIQDAIQDSTLQSAARHREAKDTECLNHLCLTDPSADKLRIEEHKGGLFKDSYSWIIRHADFQKFLGDPDMQLLWIKGAPGKGKTMLMCGIIDELRLTGRLISYFFCEQANSKMNSATAILRGLIFVLATQQPLLLSYLRKKYDEQGQKLFESENTWVTLKEIFYTMIQAPETANAVILVDALDECATGRKRFLDFILQCTELKPCRVKWIVSSRNNWVDIDERMRRMELTLQLQLELNQELVSDAIASYITHKVDILSGDKGYPEDLKNQVEEYLRENAKGTFLWVALVCQALQDQARRRVMATLHTFPPNLDGLYKRMMQDVDKSSDATICKDILAVACLVYQPLTMPELVALVPALQEFETDEVDDIIGECGSFLAMEQGLIRFVHQSAKDFLLEHAATHIFPSGTLQHHRLIVVRSIEALSRVLRRDMYGLEQPGYAAKDIIPPSPDPLAPIRYSCLHWVAHLKECSEICEEEMADDGIIDQFIQQKYLYWLECFSLLRSMSQSGRALADLENVIPTATSPKLSILVKDGNRVLRSSKTAIAEAPLQAYASALMFCPKRSLIRQRFERDMFTDMALYNFPEVDWNPCTHMLEFHGASCLRLRFINNDQQLFAHCEDESFEIWDIVTGECWTRIQREEDFDCHSTSSAVSTNGKLAIIGCCNGTLEVWDLQESIILRKLDGHSDAVRDLVILDDEETAISVAEDGTVRHWNINNGTSTVTELAGWGENIDDGFERVIINYCLSPNGQLLCTQVQDEKKSTEVRNGVTHITQVGSKPSELRIHNTLSGTIAMSSVTKDGNYKFSEDGTKLALLSYGDEDSGTIRILDANTLQSITSISTKIDESTFVDEIEFAKDGNAVISTGWDGTITVWDIETGADLLHMRGREAEGPIALSRDRKVMVSSSKNGVLLVWDLTLNLGSQADRHHMRRVSRLTLSPDQSRVATSSYYGDIKIWDTKKRKCLKTFDNPASCVPDIKISTDNSLLLIASPLAGEILVWDTSLSQFILTLYDESEEWSAPRHNCDHGKALLSSNSQTIIAIVPTGDIRVYDIASGALLQTLSGHQSLLYNIIASPDGKTFATVSDDGHVIIWDMLLSPTPISEFWTDQGSSLHLQFSTDSQQLALFSEANSFLTIWDCATGICKNSIAQHSMFPISPAMVTNASRIDPVDDSEPMKYLTCTRDHRWIVRDGLPVIWLPPVHRMGSGCVASTETTVFIGCTSGHVLFFEFDRP